MEGPTTWVSYAAAWLAAVVLVLVSRRLRRRKLNLPPGPKPWPIIGNLNLIGPLPHRSIHELSLKYGPIMQLRFGSFPVVVGSSAEMAKAFLKTHDITFASRPKIAAGKYTTYNYSDITWSPYGPYWRQARKMCLMELFCAKRLDSSEYIRREEMKACLKGLFEYSNSKRPVVLKDSLSTVSLNVISRMMLGNVIRHDSSDAVMSLDEFKKMIDELLLLSGVFNIGDSIPWLLTSTTREGEGSRITWPKTWLMCFCSSPKIQTLMSSLRDMVSRLSLWYVIIFFFSLGFMILLEHLDPQYS